MKKVLLIIITIFVIANAVSQDATIYKLPDGVSPVIDGYIDSLWYMFEEFYIDKPFMDEEPTLDKATWQAVWNDTAIFIIVSVEEDNFCPQWCKPSLVDWMSDKPEVYLDVNEKLKDGQGPGAQPNGHYQFAPWFIYGEDHYYFSGQSWQGWDYSYAYKIDGSDYVFEYAILYSSLTDKNGMVFDPYRGRPIGFDVTVIDRDEGENIRNRSVWMNDGKGQAANESWSNMDDCGVLAFDATQPNDTILCGTERVAYTSFDVPKNLVIDYVWNSDGGEILHSGENYAIMQWDTAGEKNISLIITKITSDKDTFEHKLTVYPGFSVSLGEDFAVYKDTGFTITPVTVNGLRPFNYFWDSQSSDSVFAGSFTESSYVSLTIEDDVGCIATDTIFITIAQRDVIIPDTAFLYALMNEGIDTNGDSLISYSECEAITYLDISEKKISNITGIEAFTNLHTLVCISNQLTSLNVSGCTALLFLDCRFNQLTSLDISSNTALITLRCGGNQLTSLDVTNNSALTGLGCSDNQLKNLNVSNNTDLEWLYCSRIQLTSLDVTNNSALTGLDCSDNHLTSLDVSNNADLEYLKISDMATLYKICVWEMPFPPEDRVILVDTTDSPNVYFTTDCAVNIPDDYKEKSTIDVYPNPSDDIINIKIENINNPTVEIYNISGKLVFSKELNSKFEKIDISGLSAGLYFMKVRQENNARVEKLIVY